MLIKDQKQEKLTKPQRTHRVRRKNSKKNSIRQKDHKKKQPQKLSQDHNKKGNKIHRKSQNNKKYTKSQIFCIYFVGIAMNE